MQTGGCALSTSYIRASLIHSMSDEPPIYRMSAVTASRRLAREAAQPASRDVFLNLEMLAIVSNSKLMVQEKIDFVNCRGTTLAGVLHLPPSTPRGAVILCHGMESTKNSEKLILLADALAARAILAFRFDFSYVGESGAEFADITYSGEVDDLRAAFELVSRRAAGKVALFGSSMGGTVALLFAAQEPSVAGVVSLAAPIHPENFPKRVLTPTALQEWRTRGFTTYHGQRLNVALLEDLENLDVPAAARRIACPVLILHGDKDEIVPVAEAYELHACLRGSKRLKLFHGADHRLSAAEDMRLAMQEALTWLVDSVG